MSIMDTGQMVSKRVQGSNWLKIAISFITIRCYFQANKIKLIQIIVSSFQIIILLKQWGWKKINASVKCATDSYFFLKKQKLYSLKSL